MANTDEQSTESAFISVAPLPIPSDERARWVYAACYDWWRDTGDCLFCNTSPPGNKHDNECPMVSGVSTGDE